MSTPANIFLDWNASTTHWYIKRDGYPYDIIPMLEDMVERNKEFAEEEYQDPSGKWRRELVMELQGSETVEQYRNQGVQYYYKVGEQGGLYWKESMSDEWKHVSELPQRFKKKMDRFNNSSSSDVDMSQYSEDEVAEVDEMPDCDLCDNKAKYDAKTMMGQWGYLCENHFQELGVGLGEGKGQRLVER